MKIKWIVVLTLVIFSFLSVGIPQGWDQAMAAAETATGETATAETTAGEKTATAETVTDIAAEDGCKVALEQNCTDCHHIGRVCQKLGKKSKRRWKSSIKRMVKKGLKLTKKQKIEILDCLYEKKEGVLEACK